MRVFWAIVGLLAVVVSIMLLRDGADKVESVSQTDVALNQMTPAPPVTINVPTTETDEVAETHSAADSSTSASATSQPTDEATALANDLMTAAEKGTAPVVPASQPEAAAAGGQHSPTPAAPKDYEAKVDPAAMELAKHSKIEQQADGSVLIDNKFTVRGSGTAEDPYQLSWDLLTSASETYQPRLGLTQVPQRVNMLNGKHVKITGYMAFPLAQMEAKEVLIMLNMWDGCCIGIPPSPYDAIEVQLAEAIPYDKRRFINYGTLTGVMKVDPYLVNDWLLGLYLVEDGKLDFGL